IFLRDVEPHDQLFEARIGVPVDAPDVVAGCVGAVVGELDALSFAGAPTRASCGAGETTTHEQADAREASEELGVEQRAHVGGSSSRGASASEGLVGSGSVGLSVLAPSVASATSDTS